MAELSQLLLGTTEVMEIILRDDSLRKDDLMRTRRVCRHLRVVIDGTPSLQTKLFLAPDYGTPSRSVGFIPAARYQDYVYINKYGHLQLDVHGSTDGENRWSFKVGTYYRRMFLVQPPSRV